MLCLIWLQGDKKRWDSDKQSKHLYWKLWKWRFFALVVEQLWKCQERPRDLRWGWIWSVLSVRSFHCRQHKYKCKYKYEYKKRFVANTNTNTSSERPKVGMDLVCLVLTTRLSVRSFHCTNTNTNTFQIQTRCGLIWSCLSVCWPGHPNSMQQIVQCSEFHWKNSAVPCGAGKHNNAAHYCIVWAGRYDIVVHCECVRYIITHYSELYSNCIVGAWNIS